MIRATELRIGNIVDFGDPEPDEAGHMKGHLENRVITGSDIVRAEEWPTVFYPIPLTEEWLSTFGFSYHFWKGIKYMLLVNQKIDIRLQAPEKEGDGWFPTLHYDACNLFNREIYSVHQLQNLFFALTGEELTVKL